MSAARSAYDDWHREHPTGAGLWYELARRVLRDHLAGMSVLEIGCGGGSFSAWMAAEGATRVVGADFSPTAIASAQAEFRADNLEFDMTDITAMDYLGETFDIVVSCETLEHVPSPQAAVRELARVLRPNGLLVLSVPNYLSITGAHRMFWKVTGRRWDEGGQPMVHWTMLPRTLWWLRRAGLKRVGLSGDGWFIPVRGKSGGYAWSPPAWMRPVCAPFALHQVIEARKP